MLSFPGVIIFGSDQEVAGVMAAVTRARATDAFRWVGSDGWSARSLVSDGNEEAVEGTISVQPQANEVKGFKEYFLNLTVENNKRNPWFVGESLGDELIFIVICGFFNTKLKDGKKRALFILPILLSIFIKPLNTLLKAKNRMLSSVFYGNTVYVI